MVKRLIVISTVLALLFALFGCDKVNKDERLEEYKKTYEGFIDTLVMGTLDKAEDFMHSSSEMDIKEYCERIATEYEIELEGEYKIYSFRDAYYEETDGGTSFCLGAKVDIGDDECYVFISFIDDGEKDGIKYFDILPRV